MYNFSFLRLASLLEEGTYWRAMRPSQVLFGNRGTRVFISGEQGNKGKKNEGNRGTEAILGNREHGKSRG